MSWLDNSQEIIAILVIVTWAIGFSVPALRGRIKNLGWLTGAVLIVFVAVMATDLFLIARDYSGQQKIWARGWIGPREQNGAITIGILEDTMGLTLAVLAAVLGGVLSFNRGLIRQETDSEKVHSGILMCVTGVAVSWLALTPWLSILGMVLVTLGGFVMLSAKKDPELMAQFARARSWGFVLCFLGAAVLAGDRPAILLVRSLSLAVSPLPSVYDSIGGALLLTGLYLYLQPFPFLAWLSKPAKISTATSVLLAQLLPAVASFGLVIRMEPLLRPIGVFTVFGYVSLVSAVLASVCGLLQNYWKTALPLWISAALSLAFSVFCFFGGATAVSLLLGILFCGSALSFLASAQELGLSLKQQSWLRALVFLALGPGIGFVGFVSAGGLVRAFFQSVQDPVRLTLLVVTSLAVNLLLMKCGFSILWWRSQNNSQPAQDTRSRDTLVPLISAGVLIALSLGLIWSGTFTGSVIPHDPDRVFSSWLDLIFGSSGSGTAPEWADDSISGIAEGAFAATLLLPILMSIWLFGRGQDRINHSLRKATGFRQVISSGFGADRVGNGLVYVIAQVAAFLDERLTSRVLVKWIPKYLGIMVHTISKMVGTADRKVHEGEGAILRQWVEVPAKALQLIQNGDVQWYLFFAIGSVVAILIHFIRV
jgi:hypothetical protein